MRKLSIDFYKRNDVLSIARELLGKIIVTRFEDGITSGRIVETEAYVALTDKASHSFGGRRTARNEHMYGNAGTSYVYICYGMHHLFNIVTNEPGIPDAVLIRAVEPLEGIPLMLKRCGKLKADHTLTRGPGNAGRALGISKIHSGLDLIKGKTVTIGDDGFILPAELTGTSKRIGIDGAGADALLPYRFYIRGNKYVSGQPNK